MLARLMDDEELAQGILTRFLESTPEQIESLRQSLTSGDAAAANRTAQAIKGAASNISRSRSMGHASLWGNILNPKPI
jgi:HPt (histidine-containing phosphotransfer) domain-containing protein